MKRKFVVFIGGVAIVVAAAVNLSLNSNNGSLSDLALANIEALAKNETGSITCDQYCSSGAKCWKDNDRGICTATGNPDHSCDADCQ